MKTEEILTLTLEHVKHFKEEWVSDNGPDDIPVDVKAWRGGVPVAGAMLPTGDMEFLDAARFMIYALDADAVAVSLEILAGNPEREDPNLNPLTGNEFKLGEIHDLYENHDGVAKGWVLELITVMVITRGETVMRGILSYRYRDGKVEWLDHRVADEDTGGSIADALLKAMRKPSLSVQAQLPAELDRNRLDIAAMAFLQEHLPEALVGLYSIAGDSERQDLIDELGMVPAPNGDMETPDEQP